MIGKKRRYKKIDFRLNRIQIVQLCFCIFFLASCKSGPFNLLKPASPHQEYERRLINAGLNQTTMGTMWINNAQQSLLKALPIKLPYQENGYFSAEKVDAAAFRFNLVRGQKLQVKITKKPSDGFMIYADVWESTETANFKLLGSGDTLSNSIQLDADKSGIYVLRLQPELLGSGEYTLEITTGPSLNYPLKAVNKNQIQSFWGVGRDNNTRRHEGIDIFAPFRTPVIAVSPGRVTGVNTNNLGGKVVWFRPEGKEYTLYYAHLDEQNVTEGQTVNYGDTLGRMGDTGNAQGGPPHLHFGIYTSGGAIDPLPFINPTIENVPKIVTSLANLNTTMRTSSPSNLDDFNLKIGTTLRVLAAAGSNYRIELPDGKTGYLAGKTLTTVSKPLTKLKIKTPQSLFDKPKPDAAVKLDLKEGQTVDVLGNYGDYQLVSSENNVIGWLKTNI
ncbi:M23 family metallopeptidase [Pedobacter frigiditerrae]|uniref:M23 family metallopeptidase n=1 Tax=Pedobacter frigiditerrae TaxID=2530452 RepID=A0A4R0N804_9SPHI|nr:M23 family metallopeptidase [Pedobacter frigiditerrae]TCC94334.1 M23 family metallopeptidase [Pedobacter frigiditerrae]